MINRPITPVKSVKKHKLLAATFVVFFTAIAVLAGVLIPPVYRSSSLIHVSPRYIGNLGDDSSSVSKNYQEYANNQIYIIQSYEVLKDALLRLGDKAEMWSHPRGMRNKIFSWGKTSKELAPENLASDLQIELLPKSNIIEVALEDTSPEGLAETVNAIVSAYMFRIRGDMVLGKDERRSNLRKRKRELQEQMHNLKLTKVKLSEELGVFVSADQAEDPFRKNVEALYSALYDSGLSTVRAKAVLNAENKRFEELSDEKLRVLASAAADKNTIVREAYKALADQKALLKSLVDNMKPTHPKRAKVEYEIKIRTKDYDTLREKVVEDEIKNLHWEMQNSLLKAKFNAEQAVQVEAELRAKLDDYKKRTYRYNSLYQQATDLQREITRVREQLEKIEDTLDSFITEENAPGSIKLSSIARYPESPNYRNKIKFSVMLFFLGVVLSIGVPSLLDMLNPWVMTPQDIKNRIGYPPIACIVEGDTPLLMHFADDQIRRMALSIDSLRMKGGVKKILVTSVKAGGGTTEICLRLCRAFGKIGISSLLVEANVFKPDRKYAEKNMPGLLDIIRDGMAAYDCIIPADERKKLPDRIPVGHKKRETLLPSGLQLNSYLDGVLKEYELCMFDTPAILLSADAELVARSCDAAILVVEAEGVTFHEMQRAVNLLSDITENTAIVLNRAVIYKGSGYFAEILKEYQPANTNKSGGILSFLFPNRKKADHKQ